MTPAMRTFIFVFSAIVLSASVQSPAQDRAAEIKSAREKYRAGDLDGALESLEPLLKADRLDAAAQQQSKQLAAQVLEARGSRYFRNGRIAESIADFDRQLELQPQQTADHWKRGIAYYYAGQFEQGKQQFEHHQTVNPQDVENSAWHFLCAVRAPGGSVEAARRNLIAVTRDPRVPMAQIQKMFAGNAIPDEVLQAGKQAKAAGEFYANLYVGLYYEALGKPDESLRFITQAADSAAAKDNYMGDVARVHVMVRKQAAPSATKHDEDCS